VAIGASSSSAFLALVQAAQGGDRNAFDKLDRECRGGIERVLRSRGVRRAEDVADLTQEVLIVAWQHLHQLRNLERFKSWLWVIARRVAGAHGQRFAQDDAEELSEKESDAAGPDVVAELNQLSELVTTAIHGLSERDQMALTLMSVGFQPLDIAEAMGVSPNTAKQVAKRARDRLREQLRVELSSRRRQEGCSELAKLVDAHELIQAARHARSCPVCMAAEDDVHLYQATADDDSPSAATGSDS
jgi:RNA polymerase sigma-70 factor (ECF subfamily)